MDSFASQIGDVALFFVLAVTFLAGWLARRFAAKTWPDEVAAADALAKSSPSKAEALLRDALDKAGKL